MRVVQVSFFRDPLRRAPHEVLKAWPSVQAIALAARSSGLDVQVVQAHHTDETWDDVTFACDPVAAVVRLRPDVVHVNGLGQARPARAILSQLEGGRVVVQNHDGQPAARWRRPLIRWSLRHVHGLLFTAREQAGLHAGALPRGVRIFEVVESSTDFTPGDRAEARVRTGLHGDPCVLWVGRLDANKDPLTALRAISQASLQLPDLQLWCCFTEHPLLSDVRAAIADDARLRERVTLVGKVEHAELEHYYRAADLLLSCSHKEGSGYALIEAIGCGLQPVCSNIPSFRKITGSGTVGALVQPGDAAGFASAILRAQTKPHTPERVRAHFAAALSFQAMGRDLRAAYEAVLS